MKKALKWTIFALLTIALLYWGSTSTSELRDWLVYHNFFIAWLIIAPAITSLF